ncbi:Gldg family protein [Pleurocapsales cyanobacterium LEGE 10410]|nr:Gldg family protein [Pleurocapsales cyanobacterium LEGE 10410]
MTRIVLFFHGIALGVAGIVAISITGWSIVPIILLVSGTILFALSLWLGRGKQIWQQPSTKQGVNAVVTTIMVLLVVGLINWLGIRYDRRWDLTENQLYTLSAQSQILVAELEQPLEVLVFDRQIDSELENLLENYRRYSQQFQFRLINPEQEIGLAQQYGIQSLGEIYIQYGDRQQKLDSGNATETQLTNAIEKIKRDRPTNIYFLQGHGEASLEFVEGGLAQMVSNLKDRGHTVRELNLAHSGNIPDDADLIIIAGATRKLLAAEVSTLQQYLTTGGNLLLLLSPNTDLGITPLLQNWGIELDNRLIVDGSGAGEIMGFGPAVAIVNDYGEHPITASFRNGIALFPESRPLKISEQAGIESTPLIISNRQTWAESDLSNEEITFDATKDLSGPLNMAIASVREQPDPSRLVVFGSSTFATNGWFEQQLNGDILLNSISWLLRENRDALTLRPQEPANRRLNLGFMQATIISWLALRIMPLIALIAGAWLWWRRR